MMRVASGGLQLVRVGVWIYLVCTLFVLGIGEEGLNLTVLGHPDCGGVVGRR